MHLERAGGIDEERRSFLRTAGGALGALALVPGGALLRALGGSGRGPSSRAITGRIGIQLYTVRGLMARDASGTLEKLALIGYEEVELVGLHGKSAKEMRDLLDRHGLAAPSSHVGTAELRGDWERTLADAVTLGQRFITCAWIDESDRTLHGYREIADLFDRCGETARRAGLQLCYHNHDFEFTRMGGTVPYDLLLRDCDPDLVKMELDIYWLVKSGRDPLEYFQWYPGRFPLVHVTDMDATGRMVDAGQGVIGFRGIFEHATQAGIEHCFVEHDEPRHPLATARAGYEYLRALDV